MFEGYLFKDFLIYFRPRIGGQVILDSGLKGIVSKIDTRGKVVVQLQDSNEIKKISFSSVFNSRFVYIFRYYSV